MRKYRIFAFVGLDTHTKIIEARNSVEANAKALSFGHEKSRNGQKFLQGVRVQAVRSTNSKSSSKKGGLPF